MGNPVTKDCQGHKGIQAELIQFLRLRYSFPRQSHDGGILAKQASEGILVSTGDNGHQSLDGIPWLVGEFLE